MKQLDIFGNEQEILNKSKLKKPYKSNEKLPLVISFSAGETSALMLIKLWEKYKGKREICVVFANTGFEQSKNYESLEFVHKIEYFYDIPINWIEAYIPEQKGIAPTPILVDYWTADREGYTMTRQSEIYGKPAITSPHCTRDLKRGVIRKFCDSIYGKGNYETAIGIRMDEVTRINVKKSIEDKLIYPLITDYRLFKRDVLSFWASHKKKYGFRLGLERHEGNCDLCFKKSEQKLVQLIRDEPCRAIRYITIHLVSKDNNHDVYRKNRDIFDLIELAKLPMSLDAFDTFETSCDCSR